MKPLIKMNVTNGIANFIELSSNTDILLEVLKFFERCTMNKRV